MIALLEVLAAISEGRGRIGEENGGVHLLLGKRVGGQQGTKLCWESMV